MRSERRQAVGLASDYWLVSRSTNLDDHLPELRVKAETKLFNDKLREWEDFHNYNRLHVALSGQTPYERLREKIKLRV
jgi:hypothetical protein